MTRVRHLPLLLLIALLWDPFAGPAGADGLDSSPVLRTRSYLEVSPTGRADLDQLFTALEASVSANEPQADPVVIVLHGAEAEPFIRENYLEDPALVDRAAKLRAFDRIELRICENWMSEQGYNAGDQQPFIDLIPLAPEEVRRLEGQGYVPYPSLKL